MTTSTDTASTARRGGLNAVLRELRSELRTAATTVSGRTLGENIELGDRRAARPRRDRRPDPA